MPEGQQGHPEHRADQPAEKPPRKSRRVTTEPPAGSDPLPTGEPPRHRASENDERLKADKPPHWG